MKSHLITLAVITLLPHFSMAQSNFKPGYIVNLSGDTLKGYIDYREWDDNPTEIRFRKGSSTVEEKIFSADIKAFDINGLEHFESYKLRISQGQTDVSKLSVGVDTGGVITQVFLQRVATGKNVMLYSFKDHVKNRFFIKENTDKRPAELVYQVYLNPSDPTQFVEQKKFRNQLYLLALKYKPDEKLYKKIESAAYGQPEIVAIINKLNGITNQSANTARKKNTTFFAGIGILQGNATYSGDIALAQNATGQHSYSPVIDMGTDLFLNPNVRRLLIRLELAFYTSDFKTTTHTPLFAQHTFNLFDAALTPQIVYNLYNTDKFKFYIGAGASVNISHYSNNDYKYAIEPYSGTYEEQRGYPELSTSWISFIGKAGIVLNRKVDIYFGYAPPETVTDHYAGIAGDIKTIRLGINYIF